ncbi:MAG: hypothetical protein WC804_00875 [Sphingomonas sp.]|jgi:hypothetical protein
MAPRLAARFSAIVASDSSAPGSQGRWTKFVTLGRGRPITIASPPT